MNKTPINLNKPVQTRDGRKARIICTDAQGDQPVAALIEIPGEDYEQIERFNLDGSYWHSGGEDDWNLVNVPEETVEYVNYYGAEGTVSAWDTQRAADAAAVKWREALLKVTKVDGKVTKVEVL